MKKTALIWILLLAFLCTSCGGKTGGETEQPPTSVRTEEPEENAVQGDTEAAGDSEAVTAGGPVTDESTKTAGDPQAAGEDEAWEDPLGDRLIMQQPAFRKSVPIQMVNVYGKKIDRQGRYGVREVRVFDDEGLKQTITVREAIESEWGEGMPDAFYDYTECPELTETIKMMDLNLDGNTDFGLYGWTPNNTIPYYCWIWDPVSKQYQYMFTLQGVEVHREEGEISSEYRDETRYIREYYKPDGKGVLYLDRVDVEDWGETDEKGRPAYELWKPEPGKPIQAGESGWSYTDLNLATRKPPEERLLSDEMGDILSRVTVKNSGE